MRPGAGRFALGAAALILALATGEAVLRVAASVSTAKGRHALHEPRPDRAWLYGLRPGIQATLQGTAPVVYRINSDGFRDDSYERQKPAGTFRTVVLGDSIAFGYGVDVEDSFPKVMERSLRAVADEGAMEVLNLGVSGYNPYTEAKLLEDVGASYDPDLVLVQFCINDLNDPTLHFDAHTRLHLGTIPDEAYPDPSMRTAVAEQPGIVLRWCRRSLLCSLVDDKILAALTERPGQERAQAAAMPNSGVDGIAWRWLERRYDEMARASRALGARFAILAVPHVGQLVSSEMHAVRRQLLALGERNGWVVVDPFPAFRTAMSRGDFPLFDLWHPTSLGHRLIAEETIEKLQRDGLLPGNRLPKRPRRRPRN